MKFNIELIKKSVPFCIPTESRTEEDLLSLESELEKGGFVTYERVATVNLGSWAYYGVDGGAEMVFNDNIDYYKEGKDNVTLLQWEDLLLPVTFEEGEEPKIEWDGTATPPVGTICQASVFGKGELVTGEIIKIRHNGTREVAAIMDSETFEVDWSHKFYPIPKEPTWQDEIISYLKIPSKEGFVEELPSTIEVNFKEEIFYLTESEYLEMCRIALRAKGEIV